MNKQPIHPSTLLNRNIVINVPKQNNNSISSIRITPIFTVLPKPVTITDLRLINNNSKKSRLDELVISSPSDINQNDTEETNDNDKERKRINKLKYRN